MPATADRAAFVGQAVRWVESADTNVRTAHLLAREEEAEGFFRDSAGAGAANARIHGMLKAWSRVVQVTVPGVLRLNWSGTAPRATVDLPDLGLEGVTMTVIAAETDTDGQATRLTLIA